MIGNAVPPLLAVHLAEAMSSVFRSRALHERIGAPRPTPR
jgi:hypothetical protein